MEPFVLLTLAEGPAYGYDLAQSIAALGFRRAAQDPSMLYKLLRTLEDEGFAASTWADSSGGPPRRVYALTRAGEDYLRSRAADLQRQAKRIALFVDRYRSWADRGRRRGRRRSNGAGAEGGS